MKIKETLIAFIRVVIIFVLCDLYGYLKFHRDSPFYIVPFIFLTVILLIRVGELK